MKEDEEILRGEERLKEEEEIGNDIKTKRRKGEREKITHEELKVKKRKIEEIENQVIKLFECENGSEKMKRREKNEETANEEEEK